MDIDFKKTISFIIALFAGLFIFIITGISTTSIIYVTIFVLFLTFFIVSPYKEHILMIVFYFSIPFYYFKHLGDMTPGGPEGIIWHGGLRSLQYTSLNELTLIAMAGIAIIDSIVKRERFSFRREDFFFVAFLGCAIFSVLFNETAWKYGFRYLRELFMFTVIFFYFSRKFNLKEHIHTILFTFLFLTFIEVIVAFLQLKGIYLDYFSMFGADPSAVNIKFYTSDYVRVFGAFSGPNPFAMFINMVLPLLAAGIFYVKKRELKILFFLGCFLGSIALFFTYSRGAWISLALQIVLFLWFGRKILPGWVYDIRLFLIAFILVSLLIFTQIDAIVFRLFAHESKISGLSRLSQFKVAFYYFINNPFVGIGLGNYTTNLSLVDRILNVKSWGLVVHNYYLKTLAEIGIFGLFFYLSLYYLSIKKLFEKIKANNLYSVFFLGVVTSLIGHMIHNLVDIAETLTNLSAMLFLLFGISNCEGDDNAF